MEWRAFGRQILDLFDERVLRWVVRAGWAIFLAGGFLNWRGVIDGDSEFALVCVAFGLWFVASILRQLQEAAERRAWLDTLPPPQSPSA